MLVAEVLSIVFRWFAILMPKGELEVVMMWVSHFHVAALLTAPALMQVQYSPYVFVKTIEHAFTIFCMPHHSGAGQKIR